MQIYLFVLLLSLLCIYFDSSQQTELLYPLAIYKTNEQREKKLE